MFQEQLPHARAAMKESRYSARTSKKVCVMAVSKFPASSFFNLPFQAWIGKIKSYWVIVNPFRTNIIIACGYFKTPGKAEIFSASILSTERGLLTSSSEAIPSPAGLAILIAS